MSDLVQVEIEFEEQTTYTRTVAVDFTELLDWLNNYPNDPDRGGYGSIPVPLKTTDDITPDIVREFLESVPDDTWFTEVSENATLSFKAVEDRFLRKVSL